MRHYPIFLDLQGRRALVLGEGEPAERKAAPLRAAGAIVTVCSHFDPMQLSGCALAIGANAPDPELIALSQAARSAGIPVNIVDRPELCGFISPAIVDRDPLTIAISSGGAAPVLARLLRARIEQVVAPGWGGLAALAERMKEQTRKFLPDMAQRRRVLERIFTGPAADLAIAGDDAGAERAYLAGLEGAETPGIVHLVGAGPGAADLISLRGQRLLGEADVVVHDRLGTGAVLDLARRDAARVDVGKSHGDHTMAQAEINELLIRLAREGKRVVRLKGGDPFVFGRGGEEIEALEAAGILVEVVPGITAALACAASARIPLTHRAAAHAVTFVTAHRRREDLDIDYAGLLRPGVTLAIYMGLANLPKFRAEFRAAGFSEDVNAAMIESGGTPGARSARGTLRDLADGAAGWTQGGPVLILLGGAVDRAPAITRG